MKAALGFDERSLRGGGKGAVQHATCAGVVVLFYGVLGGALSPSHPTRPLVAPLTSPWARMITTPGDSAPKATTGAAAAIVSDRHASPPSPASDCRLL